MFYATYATAYFGIFSMVFGARKIPPAHRCTNGILCLFRQYKMRAMRPHKTASEHFVLMLLSQPVGKLSDSGCKLDCGRLASVSKERCAAHGIVELVVLEAQHDAVLRVGGYPAILHFLGRLEYKSFFAHSVMSRAGDCYSSTPYQDNGS